MFCSKTKIIFNNLKITDEVPDVLYLYLLFNPVTSSQIIADIVMSKAHIYHCVKLDSQVTGEQSATRNATLQAKWHELLMNNA